MTFLYNRWYAAAWVEEIGEKPIGRTILDESITFYRTAKGDFVALASACPHRFAPLYFGDIVGDNIKCRYHGLQFGPDGTCVHSPDGSKPPKARVKSYHVLEKDDMLWIWMGGQEPTSDISPTLSQLLDLGYGERVHGYLPVDCNYILVADNLVDYAHTSHLHPSFATDGAIEYPKGTYRQEGECIYAEYLSPDSAPGSFLAGMSGMSGNTDQWSTIRWEPAAFINIDAYVTGVGRPKTEGISVRISNLITPETRTRTHYFWAASRNFKLEDKGISEMMRFGIQDVFEKEDRWMLEGQQKMTKGTDFWSLKPLLLPQDRHQGMTTRVLQNLIVGQANQ